MQFPVWDISFCDKVGIVDGKNVPPPPTKGAQIVLTYDNSIILIKLGENVKLF
jgi:hypothetical protein